jgi:hypothetical protein
MSVHQAACGAMIHEGREENEDHEGSLSDERRGAWRRRQGGLRPPAGRRPAALVARQNHLVWAVSRFMSFIGFTPFMSRTL